MPSAVLIPGARGARRRPLRVWARGLVAGWLLLAAAGGRAQGKPSEYDVKAAYLLNFGKFMRVSGAEQARGSFDICILGRDPMGASMDQIAANETIGGQPVRVRRLADATQAKGCQIVYISPFEGRRIREDLAILDGSNALTVGGTGDFLSAGGMIQFILDGDHVRFKVNLNAANRAHIVLSSELLRVAAAVEGSARPGGAR